MKIRFVLTNDKKKKYEDIQFSLSILPSIYYYHNIFYDGKNKSQDYKIIVLQWLIFQLQFYLTPLKQY